MHMICPSMSIPASTELTEFLYISFRQKIVAPAFGTPSAGARGICPCPPTRRHCNENNNAGHRPHWRMATRTFPVIIKFVKVRELFSKHRPICSEQL